jgi:hypothetical protein
MKNSPAGQKKSIYGLKNRETLPSVKTKTNDKDKDKDKDKDNEK